MHFAFELATGLEGCDYAAIARGFGCHGDAVTQADAVASAIERALGVAAPDTAPART